MYKLIKTIDPDNEFSKATIQMIIPDDDINLPDFLECVEAFLRGCGFGLNGSLVTEEPKDPDELLIKEMMKSAAREDNPHLEDQENLENRVIEQLRIFSEEDMHDAITGTQRMWARGIIDIVKEGLKNES